MKRLSLLLLIGLLSLNFTSCSKGKGEAVEANLKFVMGATASTFFSGGAMLYGEKEGGGRFGYEISQSPSELILDLSQGQWNFYVVGWEGPDAMTGKIRCGKLENQRLSKRRQDLVFNINNENCADPSFSTRHHRVGGEVVLQDVGIHSCRNISGVSANDASVTTCDGPGEKAGIRSFRVRLRTFAEGQVGFIPPQSHYDDVLSECYEVQGGNDPKAFSALGLTLNLPSGDGFSPFETAVEGFLLPSCDGQAGVHVTEFDNGVFSPSTTFADARAITYVAPDITSIFINARDYEICNASEQNGVSPFSGGDGSALNPFGICFPQQFNTVGSDSTLLAQSYRLLQHVDFMQTMAGVGLPGSAPCADLGQNTIPFGGYYNDGINCSGPLNTISISHHFSGTFFGNNKTMYNINIEEGNFESIGLFRHLASSGVVQNLDVQNLSVRGLKYIGGIAGKSEGAIQNVHVKRVSVESEQSAGSDSDVGGLIGTQVSGSLIQSSIKDGVVESDDYNLGGLVGNQNAAGSIGQSFFAGAVLGNEHSSATEQKVGGIVGITFGTISYALSEGVLVSSYSALGGIAGFATTGSNVNNVYSGMAVISSAEPGVTGIEVGGLIGKHTSSTGLNYGIFAGVVTQACNSNNTTCLVGEIVGEETGTASSNTVSIRTIGPSPLDLGGDRGTFKTQAELLNPGSNIISGWTGWNHQPADFPRFDFDNRECTDPANLQGVGVQASAGRGTASNPIKLCHRDQFHQINSNLSLHYKIINSINLRTDDATPSIESITNLGNFSGHLDGNGFPLMGYNPVVGGPNYSLFDSITSGATIENLVLAGPQMMGGAGKNNLAFLAEVNDGHIDRVRVAAGNLVGDDYAGMITVTNNGLIENSHVSGQMMGDYYIGGVTSTNNGKVRKTISKLRFEHYEQTPHAVAIGGLVARNTSGGEVSESSFDGNINIKKSPATIAGGIVGQNQGLVEDVIFEKYATVRAGNATDVGGIVGSNEASATINRAISLGAVVYDGVCAVRLHDNNSACTAAPASWSPPTETEYGAIAGGNAGSIMESFYKVKPIEDEDPDTATFISISYNSGLELCEITLGTFSPNPTVSPNFALVIDSGSTFSKSYKITNGTNAPVTVEMSEKDCNNLSGTNTYSKMAIGTNSYGTQLTVADLTDRATYNTSWDMVAEHPNDPGFPRLLNMFFARITGEPRPINAPTWTLESDRFPKLGIDD